MIAEEVGEIKSTKKLLKYSMVQYNAVAMENTVCFCYAPPCMYSTISEFGKNVAEYGVAFTW